MAVSGLGVAYTTAGLVLAWSGLKNEKIGDTLRSLLRGQNPPAVPGTPPVLGVGTGAAATTGSPGSGAPPAPASVSGNVATGKMLAAAYGWSKGPQWDALYALWQRESSWSNTAKNPASGAYGIAQALPPTKYPFRGQEAGGSDPATQISWGLAYIRQRYGDPVAAWAHETANGWY